MAYENRGGGGGGYGNNRAYQSGFGGGGGGGGGGNGVGGNNGGGGGYGSNNRGGGFGTTDTGRFNDNAEDPLVAAVRENINVMRTNVGQIGKWLNMLGTNRDGQDLRDRLSGTIETTKILARDITAQLKQLATHTGNNQTKMLHQKLASDFSVWLQKFQEISKVSAQKERTIPIPPSAKREAQPKQPDTFPQAYGNYDEYHGDTEKQGLLENSRRHQLMQIENEREHNDLMIREREEGIKQIESAVIEVNEIFTDLANLVHEQGFMIDNIESNIDSTAIQTQEAVVELQKASKHQRSARSKMCILAIIIAVIAGVLTLVLVLTLK